MKQINAVQCVQCKKLHDITGKYIHIKSVHVLTHVADTASKYDKEEAPEVKFEDVIVCDNGCLTELLSQ